MLYTKPTHCLVFTLLIGEVMWSLFTHPVALEFLYGTNAKHIYYTKCRRKSRRKLQDLPVPPNHLHEHEKFSINRFHFSQADDACWLTRNLMQGIMGPMVRRRNNMARLARKTRGFASWPRKAMPFALCDRDHEASTRFGLLIPSRDVCWRNQTDALYVY